MVYVPTIVRRYNGFPKWNVFSPRTTSRMRFRPLSGQQNICRGDRWLADSVEETRARFLCRPSLSNFLFPHHLAPFHTNQNRCPYSTTRADLPTPGIFCSMKYYVYKFLMISPTRVAVPGWYDFRIIKP